MSWLAQSPMRPVFSRLLCATVPGPHDLGADVVIGRIFEGHRAVVENGADGSLDQAVGEIDVFYPREITLH